MLPDKRFEDILTPMAFELNRLTDIYVGLLAEEIMRSSGIMEFLKDGAKTPLQVMKGMGYKPFALPALTWLMNYVAETALVDRAMLNGQETYSHWNRDLLGKELLKIDPGLQPFLEYMSLIAQDYPKFFKGELSGPQIVFLEGRKKYWQYFFANEFSTYRICNQFFARAVSSSLSQRTKDFSVLEIGAGTGGATTPLLACLKESGASDHLKKYIFTDVAVGFLKNADSIIPEVLPRVPYESKLLDINQPLDNQGVEPGSVDVVFSVNCVHVAKDLIEGLQQIHRSLSSGGQVCLAEIVRPMNRRVVPNEMIFCLLSSYTDVRLKPGLRPTFGFLTVENWKACLLQAGFSKVETITIGQAGARPDHPEGAGVITGWK